jgi:zinc/manganese transport system substrate-binding protein
MIVEGLQRTSRGSQGPDIVRAFGEGTPMVRVMVQRGATAALSFAVVALLGLAAAAAALADPCPGPVINVIAVENQYGSIVAQLGGQCVRVRSIISDPSADPHEFQTDIQVGMAYQTAHLVVQNGLGYDEFSNKIIATLAKKPIVLTCGDVVGLKLGENPHLWYHPEYIMRISRAITAALKRLNPAASTYLEAQAEIFTAALAPYYAIIAEIKRRFAGTPVGATESVFMYMAQATGLQLITPPRFMQAVAEGTGPTVRDVAAFQTQIRQKQIKALIYNTQAVTNLATQLQTMAREVSIPIVGVSETLVPVHDTFQNWQVRQLQLLLQALEASRG